jgi:AraC-like DNA-binding protein
VRQRPAGQLPARCKACLVKRWRYAWNSQKAEKRFGGRCGSLNCCAVVQVLGRGVLTLTVQQPAPTSCARKRTFLRAVSLIRLIIHDLNGTLEAARASDEPRPLSAGQMSGPPPQRAQEARPRAGETPALCCPSGTGKTTSLGTRAGEPAICNLEPGHSHGQQLVERMRDYLQEHYSRPVQLGDLAAALNLNAAYVSSLFSRMTGVTFHHYLEELRLAAAKDLLRNPVNRVREVAYATGYTSPNHFHDVFKARVGMTPSAWRETSASVPSFSSSSA